MAQIFGTGGASGSSLGKQFNDKSWSRVAIIEAKKKKTFSQMGDKLTQPKHYGDKIVKYHEIPILHASNINDQGINAAGVTLLSGSWYAYDASGNMEVTGADASDSKGFTTKAKALEAITVWIGVGSEGTEADNAGAGYATEALAIAAAEAGPDTDDNNTAYGVTSGRIEAGDGNLYGGSKDILVQRGAFPALTELGGKVNQVGMKRLDIEATVSEFGYFMSFTKKSLDMDTESGLLARYSRGVGEAQGDIREAQIKSSLLAASELNRSYAGDATKIGEVGAGDVLDFGDLRLMDQALKDARCPKDTKLIDGSTKVGTATVGKARYVYVGSEMVPTLEDMSYNSKDVWVPVEMYASAGTIADGEIGKIGQFRFIEVEEMTVYEGQGANADDSQFTENSADLDDTDVANRHTSTTSASGPHYDVFPVLFVGSGSFATIGFEGDAARVTTVMPKADAHNDPYGKNGVVSISWYYGFMSLRPEWIRQIVCSAKIV